MCGALSQARGGLSEVGVVVEVDDLAVEAGAEVADVFGDCEEAAAGRLVGEAEKCLWGDDLS